jgi:dTDP-glucose pyrophosphorylase
MTDFSRNIVDSGISILDALGIINSIGKAEYQTLFVLDDAKRLCGTLTDGDIRRALLNGAQLSESVIKAVYKDFRYLEKSSYSLEEIIELKEKKILLVPVIDKDKRILRIVDFNIQKSILPVDSVIMAGGRGERLLPLTLNTPKPLLKVGGKAIIEHNVDRLARYGVEKIHITAGYLSEQIIDFFKEKKMDNADVSVVVEEERMGTIGGISLIDHFHHDTIFVMNADLLTNIDLEDFLLYYNKQESDLCIATIPYQISVPYAVLETDQHQITSIEEKPVYTYYSNAGIYLIRKSILKYIPSGKKYDATDLISAMLQLKKKVHHYPIKGYWLDIGRPEDFNKAQEDIKYLAE